MVRVSHYLSFYFFESEHFLFIVTWIFYCKLFFPFTHFSSGGLGLVFSRCRKAARWLGLPHVLHISAPLGKLRLLISTSLSLDFLLAVILYLAGLSEGYICNYLAQTLALIRFSNVTILTEYKLHETKDSVCFVICYILSVEYSAATPG